MAHDRRSVIDPRTDDLDADGDVLITFIDSQPTHGVLTLRSDGKLEYQPTAWYLGADSFTYHVSDGIHTSGVATVNLVVKNDAPELVTSSITHPHDRNLIGNLGDYVHDDDDDNLIYDVPYGPLNTAHGRVSLQADGHFTYIPDPLFEGVDSFTFTVSDGRNTTTEMITIIVQNHAPTAQNISVGNVPHSCEDNRYHHPRIRCRP